MIVQKFIERRNHGKIVKFELFGIVSIINALKSHIVSVARASDAIRKYYTFGLVVLS